MGNWAWESSQPMAVVVGALMEQVREQVNQVRWNRWVYYVEQAACLVEQIGCLDERIRGACVKGAVDGAVKLMVDGRCRDVKLESVVGN